MTILPSWSSIKDSSTYLEYYENLQYLAGVLSGGIQNDIQDMITIRTDGMQVEKNKNPGFRFIRNTAARHVNVPENTFHQHDKTEIRSVNMTKLKYHGYIIDEIRSVCKIEH